ncbi:MAG TPA: NfeD family protein [Gaiellaceae bacterium]|jgi:membrane protein implicated in regulation of membrane protease activity|nr:NfeD family protein [Gaiellaceae bacterium]
MTGLVLWLIAAVLLAIGELLTPGMFFLGPVALAAVGAAITAGVGAGIVLQLIVFIAVSVASLAFLRPIARSHVHMPALTRTGTAALVGKKALVLQQVDANGGRVRIGGEEWSARAFFDEQTLEAGSRVEIAKIEGATALVFK